MSILKTEIGEPEYFDPKSAWQRHGPFAMWLVGLLKPRVFVELGTHNGYSYFAMCQAVNELNLDARCYAVDTWSGDEHSGLYGNEVYENVSRYNDRYASFSTLLRKRFSEALSDIEDGSVDLLHVDGRHFYEDVKEDFESWIPKLSNRAVVLFHDTEVRKRNFGVWKYWAEVCSSRPSINFTHQNGLGVLFWGADVTPDMHGFIDGIGGQFGEELTMELFRFAGESYVKGKELADVQTKSEEVQQALVVAEASNLTLGKELADLESKSEAMQQALVVAETSNATLGGEIEALRAEQKELNLSHKELARQVQVQERKIRTLEKLRIADAEAIKSRSVIDRATGGLLGLPKRIRARFWGLVKSADLELNAGSKALVAGAVTLPAFSPQASQHWKQALREEVSAVLLDKRPLVSVIMPTKNRLDRISAAIHSVLDQTYDNWELIIVDDGSTDGTFEFLPTQFSDPRIRIRQSDSAGVSAARNFGILESHGEIITYLDDDNRWAPDFLEITALQLLRTGSNCSYSVMRLFNNGFEDTERFGYLGRPFDLESLRLTNYIDLNVFAHRRAMFDDKGGFDTSLRRMVDWDLIIRYCTDAPPAFCNSVGADYDNSKARDRITVSELKSYRFVVRNKHMIDWDGLKRDLPMRDQELVSVIICVYDNPELTNKCLESLLRHQSGANFEIIVVDNASTAETVSLLRGWAARESRIRLLLNPENMNFSLGNNLGFAMSRGSKVVFLNNDTEVTPEWLSSLMAPLARPDTLGVQPMLVFPDGTVQCLGLVFSDQSPFAYGLYSGLPSDSPLAVKRRSYKALTAACLAMRASDFLDAGGFDPLFVNGQEDVDLCLRVGGGKPVFTCATDAVVIHHEGKSKDRGKAIPDNRAVFCERWEGRIEGDDLASYREDGVVVRKYAADSAELEVTGLAIHLPELEFPALHSPAVHPGVVGLRLRVPCPKATLKDRWGDYHFAVAIARAAARVGVPSRIDFLDAWSDPAARGEVNVVLRGLSDFRKAEGESGGSTLSGPAKKLMWMISHPDKVTDAEIEGYDQVFVASDHWAAELSQRGLLTEILPLLQCTEVERFNLDARNGAPKHDHLYVANSRKILRSTVAKAIKEGISLDIYGEMWDGLAPADWLKGENVLNVNLPSYYAGANVVINDHWDTMRKHGFVSNRIFDVLATGAPLVTDSVVSMPFALQQACTVLEDDAPLASAIESAGSSHSRAQRDEIARWIAAEHSFAARVRQICTSLR